MGGGGGWAAGSGLKLPTGPFGLLVQELLFIGPDKPGGPRAVLLTQG